MSIPTSPSADDLRLLNSIYPVSDEAVSKLSNYVALLIKWQAKTNLVAPSTLANIWSRHIADSLQCVALFPRARKWADLGSGGGLPGIVTAIVVSQIDGGVVHLFESIGKKAAFLKLVARELDLCVVVHAGRIESEAKRTEQVEIVTARALAPLSQLLSLAEPLLDDAIGLFHKGRDYEKELQDCCGLWNFDLVKHPSKIEGDSVLLEISNLSRIHV